ncbi:tryptophan halogenase family protein [Streptomyces mirabilis]|uniref:tryptophan halogenase family protein n=1 Tax=Streptomyces mirabilis TaxID=68239 RepID=UPI00369698CE
MGEPIRNIVILGGGTAGWMAASYLGKALSGQAAISVVEAPAIPRIGVGEATVPNLQRVFFDYLGLPEEEWMSKCNAGFKMAVKFVNWRTPGPGEPVSRQDATGSDHFYHPFGLLPSPDGVPLSHYWTRKQLSGATSEPFDYASFVEPPLMDAKRSPRFLDGTRCTNYAWHFDAALVAAFLRDFATVKQGVRHIEGTVSDVRADSRGYIESVTLESGEVIGGDLFVDCSGLRGLLINKTLGEPFIDMSDHLLNNSAVATQVPHDDEANGIEPYTSSIAMPAGWTWKIPMPGRFGTGYVYCDKFADKDEAARDLCGLWGLDPEKVPLNHIKFRVGRNRRAWVGNCVSIGLSSCFVEPLESTGIYFITASLYQLVKHFPERNVDPVLRDRFNREIVDMFDDTRDFLQAHFSLSPRTDTPFWRATKELTLADQIKEKIEMYRSGVPVNPPMTDERTYYGNFEAEFRNFWTNGSYYSVFAGLGVRPRSSLPILSYRPDSVAAAERAFADVKTRQRQLMSELPSTYQYLRSLRQTDQPRRASAEAPRRPV